MTGRVAALFAPIIKAAKLASWPVGSIYMSMQETSPAALFGGTWVRMENRFLLGAGSGYVAGATGGEAEHTLTGNEMPSHYHLLAMNQAGESEYWGPMCSAMQDGHMVNMTKPAGGDQPHNNMPPYIAVYMWRRTA